MSLLETVGPVWLEHKTSGWKDEEIRGQVNLDQVLLNYKINIFASYAWKSRIILYATIIQWSNRGFFAEEEELRNLIDDEKLETDVEMRDDQKQR